MTPKKERKKVWKTTHKYKLEKTGEIITKINYSTGNDKHKIDAAVAGESLIDLVVNTKKKSELKCVGWHHAMK